ncbi:MAG: hypothetical protein EOM90_15180 [Alphaproteobacteria bacterium]|nr:hypothetical protein [Alphaproteobacteria bacterium]
MTRLPFTAIIGLMILLLSCQGNRLENDEDKLSAEILLQEKEEAERIERENRLADSLKKLPPGFRFREDRSVDPSNPPMIIDIAGSLENIKDFALSDVASKITYIRMEKLPDSSFATVMRFKYYLMDSNIVAVNPSGIILFSRNGKYKCTVVKNETTGIEVSANRMTVMGNNTFVGGGTTIWSAGNNLFYKYRNSLTGQSYIMEYDCSQPPVSLSMGFDPEKPDKIRGMGRIAIDLNHGKRLAPQKGNVNGMWSSGTDFMYQQLSSMMLDRNTYVRQLSSPFDMNGKYTLGIFGQQGDTLATFTQFEKVDRFSKTVMRGTDQGVQYENKGRYYIRNAFNDTVFLVLPPNRLLPVYVLRLGKYKLLKKEGVDPDFNLSGKIIPETWADTRNFIFLTFSKDSYNCPNTRESKQLKQYYALFSKSTRKLYLVKGDPYNYDPDILKNNLDGGMSVWPSSWMVGNHGEILISLKGKELKEHVKSAAFSASTAPAAKKNQLLKLIQSLRDDEDILMVVE